MNVIDQPEQIAAFRASAIALACDFYAKRGFKLARNMPTVAALRKQYGITARTYADAAVQMRVIADNLAKEIK